MVFEELRKILFKINIPEISRFENLNQAIYDVVEEMLKDSLAPTNKMIKNLIEVELGYINIDNVEF